MIPQHIGEILLRDVVAPLGLSGREAAEALGISPGHFRRIVKGRSRLTPQIAYRFEQVFDIRMEYLLEHQLRRDIDRLRQSSKAMQTRRYAPLQLSLPAL